MGNTNLKKLADKIEYAKREIDIQTAVTNAFKAVYEEHKLQLQFALSNLKGYEQDWKAEAEKHIEKLEDKKGETQS